MQKWFLGMLLTLFLSNCTVNTPPPHRSGLPPEHGGLPPGHGGIPPGQAKKTAPPAIVIAGVPAYVLVPGTNVSVMVGVDADVFLVNGVYYYHHEGGWYRAVNYHGPWRETEASDLPPGLRGKSPKELKGRVEGRNKKGHRPF